MARYIDIEQTNFKGLALFDENLDILVSLSDVRKALQLTPTADVVPKSEVERIFEEIEKLHLHITNEFDLRRYSELKKKYTEVR